jgi:ATP-binding cassette subfamily C (CFTR/MRP) protein 1
MQRIIREEFVGRTLIAVAHRLETILDFDRIVVMDNGVLVEHDIPANLLERNSSFRELYNSSGARDNA